MIILAIDTSFDDTAVALVDGTTILSNVLSTDLEIHLQFGGIVPNLARQAHLRTIEPLVALALKRAHLGWESVDAIAVTQGPGLAICLEVGIATAKKLAALHDKPLIPVNHLEGHLLSFLAQAKTRNTQLTASAGTRRTPNVEFALLGIILSGGNTQFVYAPKIGSYEIIGQTKDDAMGEAYDKIGRLLGLGYPAGAFLEKVARDGRAGAVPFPVPMRQVHTADMSFSGLKTAAGRIVTARKEERGGTLSKQDIADIALGFQTAALTHLSEKLYKALQIIEERYGERPRTIATGGGVICNLAVRQTLRHIAKQQGIPVYFPVSRKLCTDNAAMIAVAASFSARRATDFDRIPVYPLTSI